MPFDPIRLELMKNALGSVADEMILTVVRIAYSSIMKDTMDLSAAICDRNGLLVAQGHGLPMHMGSIPDAMEAVLRSEEHTSELQLQSNLVCRLLLEKKKKARKTSL